MAEPDAPLPVGRRDYFATAALVAAFVTSMLLAVLFAQPFADAGLQAFEDPDNVWNSIGYFALLLVFTFAILWVAKRGHKWVIRVVILGAVAATMVYVVPPLLLWAGMESTLAWSLGGVVGIASAVALWKHPEWYVIDGVGILVAAGAAAIFGISLGLVPVFVLLVALAAYDALAVYKTRHMLALADSVMELRLPVLLVIPKKAGYRFHEEVARFKAASEAGGNAKEAAEEAEDRDALFIGLGDLVIPSILVISSLVFGDDSWAHAGAWGAAIGSVWGLLMLMSFVLRGKPQAGLPLLNGGSIGGFLVGMYAASGSIIFW